ncbi:Uncharacterized protein GBIM_04946 [Gryllus bimaculatus]|nr:Uncharacterized protein GBIM_04946 [Gryllus bimaculatus]
MDEETCLFPLFEVTFELQEPDMVFIPCLDIEEPDGFYALVESLLNDILDMAKLIPRIKKTPEVLEWLERQAELERLRVEEEQEEEEEKDKAPKGDATGGSLKPQAEKGKPPEHKAEEADTRVSRKESITSTEEEHGEEDELAAYLQGLADAPPPDNYMEDVESNVTLCDVATEVLCRVQVAIGQAHDYANKFQDHAYLWLDDRQEFLEQFLKYGHALSPEEEELVGVFLEDGSPALKDVAPTLQTFKEQIDYYEGMFVTLQSIESEKIICKWLRIDVRPFRHAVLNTVCKWSNTLKQHLIHDVEYK